MYAMQYQITLPADYDMEIIRERVRRTGHLMDGFAGLEFKAYLMQEKAKGATRNSYAPFYVWRDLDGLRSFCWGEPGYSAIVRDFGRQPIQGWTVDQLIDGPATYDEARSLTVTNVPLPTGVAPSQCLAAMTDQFLASIEHSTVALVTAVDVTAWSVALVELSSKSADQSRGDAVCYEVRHVSSAA